MTGKIEYGHSANADPERVVSLSPGLEEPRELRGRSVATE